MKRYEFIAVIISLFLLINSIVAQEYATVKKLNGTWKFSIGDNSAWSAPDYNDMHWDEVKVPGAWETEGFYGYDGYAWYRLTFRLQGVDEDNAFFLDAGYIDDVDEVFVNGKRIGRTGNFPPDYATAYNAHRLYRIPDDLIQASGYLTIAIRIFDEGGEGGIIRGNPALLIDKSAIRPGLDLQGEWKFKTGNCGDPSTGKIDFSNWETILVPGNWEDQGYKHYDGIACYAREFELDGQMVNKKMVLLLGKIDDLDMVYLNGVLVGQSGNFDEAAGREKSEMYKQKRGYYLADSVLNHQGKNTLIVKVYDWWGMGGIWDGDIGLISQENYIAYWRKRKNTGQ